ncbi:odorant receptor 13a-like [Vespula squamosa]|uniref:Odorant receptor 13a-like n=1 Tax=Vespula squamosa TaxID=30214 RepID=A0ABD2C8Z3_VESSQ
MKYQKRMRKTLADLFEDSFNIVIGQHLFRITILLCIPRYRMLSSLAVIETEGIITFSCDELHSCDWYELSTMDMKSIWICMMRCSKPLRLTCAKFCILSVRTFIDPSYFTFTTNAWSSVPLDTSLMSSNVGIFEDKFENEDRVCSLARVVDEWARCWELGNGGFRFFLSHKDISVKS